MKRIFICADGTWNRPETDLRKDVPTNVLRLARAISPTDTKGNDQVVFYDWGIGSYYGRIQGGAFGEGINKNIMDGYRFIVQNYRPGDELFLFGFSRGAYTVRSLCGFINNCGVLKKPFANRIEAAFRMYKDRKNHPKDARSKKFRKDFAHAGTPWVHFAGVWDTVGALGVPMAAPLQALGLIGDRHEFHDSKIGPNIKVGRHALAIDERRKDFRPTIWSGDNCKDLEQVWFAGVHCDVGGGYPHDKQDRLLSDIPFKWLIKEARRHGARFDRHLVAGLKDDPLAGKNNSFKKFFKLLGSHDRPIAEGTKIHRSVKKRYEQTRYRPKRLKEFVEKHGWTGNVVD